MKVTRWVKYDGEYENGKDGLITVDNDKFDDVWNCVREELERRNIKFDAVYHQNGEYGVPVIDDRYVLQVSMRMWGALVAESEGNMRNFNYMDWYMSDDDKLFNIPNPEWYKVDVVETK